MRTFVIALILTACMPLCSLAQPDAPATEAPEEVIVTGKRDQLALRTRLLQQEKAAYDVFNQFNDDRNFDIHCSMHQPTGSRLEIQVCEPEFEIQAKRTHARHYFENMRDMLNQFAAGAQVPAERTPPVYIPQEAVIASQQKAYRNKLKQIAEEHPEFLEALVKYTEARKQYEQARGILAE